MPSFHLFFVETKKTVKILLISGLSRLYNCIDLNVFRSTLKRQQKQVPSESEA